MSNKKQYHIKNLLLPTLILTFLFSSCATQKTEFGPDEKYGVLNAYLPHIKRPAFLMAQKSLKSLNSPEFYFKRVMTNQKHGRRIRKSLGLKKNNKNYLLDNEDIAYLTQTYTDFKIFKWEEEKIIHQNLSLTDADENSNLNGKTIYRFSEPFYNQDKSKALMIVNYYYEGKLDGGPYMVYLEKKRGKWKYIHIFSVFLG